MKVKRRELEDSKIRRLEVVENPGPHHRVGETAAYWCPECKQGDETFDQIWHNKSCSLAGEHGRQSYEALNPDPPDAPVPEFRPDTNIAIVRPAETDPSVGLHNGEALLFMCLECGNADEDLFELVHDIACPMADEYNLPTVGESG